jgi:hypothetical protein
MLRFSFGLHVFFPRVCGLLVGGLECQCLVFALVLIVNGFASSVWHLRTLRRLFFSPSVYPVVLDSLMWQEGEWSLNTGSNFGS